MKKKKQSPVVMTDEVYRSLQLALDGIYIEARNLAKRVMAIKETLFLCRKRQNLSMSKVEK